MSERSEQTAKIIRAAMELAAEQGWRRTTLGDIAQRSGVGLAGIYRHFPDRRSILDGLARQVDAQVLAGGEADREERPRDRLFDVLMRRFDALLPYRDGLRAVAREVPLSPLLALCTLAQLRRSMGWMMAAAGLPAAGLAARVRVNALVGLWLSVLRVWFDDDSTDLAKTMAALDAQLRRGEEIINSFQAANWRKRGGSPDTEGVAP